MWKIRKSHPYIFEDFNYLGGIVHKFKGNFLMSSSTLECICMIKCAFGMV